MMSIRALRRLANYQLSALRRRLFQQLDLPVAGDGRIYWLAKQCWHHGGGRVVVVRIAYLGSLLTALVSMLMLAENLTSFLTPLMLSFLCFCFGVCNGLVIALGGADHFRVTATGLLIMALCAVLSSFLAPNSR